jgi:hypothetical protein
MKAVNPIWYLKKSIVNKKRGLIMLAKLENIVKLLQHGRMN